MRLFDLIPIGFKSLFIFIIAKGVIMRVPQYIGQIRLLCPVIGKIMGIQIVLPFYFGIGAIVMHVL